MTCIGIITGHPTKPKRRLFGGYSKEVIISEKNPFTLMVVRVPFSEEELCGMQLKKSETVLKKAKSLLVGSECGNIILSRGFQCNFPENKQKLNVARRLQLLSVTHKCIRRMCAELGINLMDAKVCIRDSKSDRISETLMRQLCFDTRLLVLCTQNREQGKIICESFLDDTGMVVPVLEEFQDSRADIVVDVDKGEIKFGRRLVIDGVQLDFELGDADVDSLEVAACLGDYDITSKILSYLSGKKKLTL